MQITAEQLPRLRLAMQSNEWFAGCPEDLQIGLLGMADIVHLEVGEVLITRDTLPDGLYCILSGGMRWYAAPPDGSSLLMGHSSSYDWFGELPLVDGVPQFVKGVASSATTLARVRRDVILEWLGRHPHHWQDIARLLALRFRIVAELLRYSIDFSLEERVVKRLMVMANSYGMRSVQHRRVTCSHDELAELVGASRPSVSLVLTKLARRGVLTLGYGEIFLHDEECFTKEDFSLYAYRRHTDLGELDLASDLSPSGRQTA